MKDVYFIRGSSTHKIYPEIGAYMDLYTAKLAKDVALIVYLYKNNEYPAEKLYVDTCEVEGSVQRLMYYFTIYTGFDYNFSTGSIRDITIFNGYLYSCMESLKDSPLYIKYRKLMEREDSEKYYIKLPDGSFGSRDEVLEDSLFSYGDVMEGKFSVKVHKIKLYKDSIDDIDVLFNRIYNNMCK